MKYFIIGGDNRFECLERILTARGESAVRIPEDAVYAGGFGDADIVIMNCTAKGNAMEKVLTHAAPDARIYTCGPKSPETGDVRIVDLWQDETLKCENAYLTAEGAVSAAMQAGTKCIRESRCLVVGWGRIGKALTELLVGMGTSVTVASRSAAGRNRAVERGAHGVNTDHLRLNGFDVVFSTPPAMVIDDKILKKAKRDVMILDLASPPYGVDLKAAWDMGIRAWREPGIPGRYCPESAANAILRAIERHI